MSRAPDLSTKFTDRDGRDWHVTFDGFTVMRLHKELGIKALDFLGVFWPALGDPLQIIDIAWVCCSERAEREGLTVRDFARGFDDEVIVRARDALFEAYIGFFQNPTKRAALEALRSAATKLQTHMAETVRNALMAASGPHSSDAPDSPESEPTSGGSG